MHRTIPATMATQHPDNARAPYWDILNDPFVGVHKEISECLACFQDLGISEFMWDWEGKYADSAVVDKLFSNNYDYFSKTQLGRDKFLTFRIPNIWEEKGYSLMQALTSILVGEDFARDLKFSGRPLFEVILPMTERADQLMQIHQSFEKLARFKTQQFDTAGQTNEDYLQLIPLVESVGAQQNIRELLDEYVRLHQKHFGRKPEYIRPFLARSDPALVSGLLATVLANKIALSQIFTFSQDQGIPVFPIAGVGGLPFRGGLTPETVDKFVKDYPGIRTASVQSSFRYDFSASQVKVAVANLERLLPNTSPHMISETTRSKLVDISRRASGHYQTTLKQIASDISTVFDAVPRRRERRQHIGLLAYQRSMGEQKLPRAITFTAAFYSLGIPPEFIGIGRTLKELTPGNLDLLTQEYPSLVSDLERAGRYINRENVAILSRRNAAWKQILNDIEAAETILDLDLGPKTHSEKAHCNLASNVLLFKNNPHQLTQLIGETAILRKSLG